MNATEELEQIVERLEQLARRGDDPAIAGPLAKLQESALEIHKSASDSWLGYHARVYYGEFEEPPRGQYFDQEWGLTPTVSNRTSKLWKPHDSKDVVAAIRENAGNPDLNPVREFDDDAREEVGECRSATLSILQIHTNEDDQYLEDVKSEIKNILLLSRQDAKQRIIIDLAPPNKGTRDHVAVDQGQKTPPHVDVYAEIRATCDIRETIGDLAKFVKRAASHLLRHQQAVSRQMSNVGTKVFIGHGHSPAWHDLRKFIKERLKLPTDEFNSEPTAGTTTIERLEQMLSSAAVAFLVMTAEDRQRDGKSHPRLNVVHETGLFQGRLGPKRAIILLEEGCEEFSNIAGLGQLRFPKGAIKSTFEDIRQILEQAGLLRAGDVERGPTG